MSAENPTERELAELAYKVDDFNRRFDIFRNIDYEMCKPTCRLCIKRSADTVAYQNARLQFKLMSGKWTPDDEFWNILGV